MAMFPKDKKEKKKKTHPNNPSTTPSFPGSLGDAPSCACPPHGMRFKKGLRAEGREIFVFTRPTDRLPGGDSARPRVLQASRGGRTDCGASVAPGLEMLNIGRLATTPVARKGGNIRRWWERDSFLCHTTKPRRTSSLYQEVLTTMCFLVTWGQDTGRERKVPPGWGWEWGRGGCTSQPVREGLLDIFVQLPGGIGPVEPTVLSWKWSEREEVEKERVCWKTTTGKPLCFPPPPFPRKTLLLRCC